MEEKLEGSSTYTRMLEGKITFLNEQLLQVETDKTFVWSLWKKLSGENPDVVAAVNIGIARERQKTEEKDRKVLHILATRDQQLDELKQKNEEHRTVLNGKQAEINNLQDHTSHLEEKLTEAHERLVRADNELQVTKLDKQQLLLKVEELDDELHYFKKEKKDLRTTNITHEDKIKELRDEAHSAKLKAEEFKGELSSAQMRLKRVENDLKNAQREMKVKESELQKLKEELNQVWTKYNEETEHNVEQAQLIRQLQSLQKETHQIMRTQDSAYSSEAVTLQKMYDELCQEHSAMKSYQQQLLSEVNHKDRILGRRDEEICRLRELLNRSPQRPKREDSYRAAERWQRDGGADDGDDRIRALVEEIEILTQELDDRERIINDLKSTRGTSTPKERMRRRGRSVTGEHNRPLMNKKRSQSYSPPPHKRALRAESGSRYSQRMSHYRTKVQKLEDLLKFKEEELKKTKEAHHRRLERLRALQKEFRLLKEQLKTYEYLEEQKENEKKSKKQQCQRKRTSAPLRIQPDAACDAVNWNEMNRMKKENEYITRENLNMKEENDVLRVELSEKEAVIRELNMCLEHEKQELEWKLNEIRHEENKADFKDRYMNNRAELTTLKRENEHLKEVNDLLMTEKETFHSRAVELEDEVERHQKKECLLKRTVKQLEDEVKEVHSMQLNRSYPATKTANRTRKSNDAMTAIFSHFDKPMNPEESSGGTTDDVQTNIFTTTDESESLTVKTDRAIQVTEACLKSKRTARTQGRDASTSTAPRIFEERATSPLKQPARASSALKAVKQRYYVLQRKLNRMRIARLASEKVVEEKKKEIAHLQEQHSALQLKYQCQLKAQKIASLEASKSTDEKEKMDKLNSDIEEKDELVKKLDAEKKSLEQRLKNTALELAKQNDLVKGLREDNNHLEVKGAQLLERVNHVERDLAQKRALLDTYKHRLNLVKDDRKTDKDKTDQFEAKIKEVAELNERQKATIESLKKQIKAVSKEKQNAIEKLDSVNNVLRKKMVELSEMASRCEELESVFREMQTTAETQMESLTRKSELALDVAHGKLQQTSETINEYRKFVEMLAKRLLEEVERRRKECRKQEENQRRQQIQCDQSLTKAKSLASSILNMSNSDIDALLVSADEDEKWPRLSRQETENDNKWQEQCQKLLQAEKNFSSTLFNLVWQKIDEHSFVTKTNLRSL